MGAPAYPEEMTGKTVAWVSTWAVTGCQGITLGFTDRTSYSIKFRDHETHLEVTEETAGEFIPGLSIVEMKERYKNT